jgi:hypothetical protein
MSWLLHLNALTGLGHQRRSGGSDRIGDVPHSFVLAICGVLVGRCTSRVFDRDCSVCLTLVGNPTAHLAFGLPASGVGTTGAILNKGGYPRV